MLLKTNLITTRVQTRKDGKNANFIAFFISYFMKFGTVNVFQTYSPELSTDFQIPEDHLLIELPLC